MMKNLSIAMVLLAFLCSVDAYAADKHSKEDGGMDECSVPDDKSGVQGNCNDYINILDGTECLWQISGVPEGSKLNTFLDGSIATKYKDPIVDIWGYKFKDEKGVASECRSRFPSVNERMYIIRQASSEAEGEIEFVVGRDYCSDRWVWSGTGYWHCNWGEDDDDNPNSTHWGDHYQAIFNSSTDVQPNDGDSGKKILRNGVLYGHHICLKRTKRGEKFAHGNNTNTSTRNKVCAYVVNSWGGCNSYFGDANSALIGCVDEANLPGPDVFNSVIPAEIAPRVDTSLCLSKDVGFEDAKCDKNKKSLVERGSTFDKPMVVMTGGGFLKQGNVTQPPVELELRYQFYKADYDNNIKTCGKMDLPGYSSKEYCAQVPLNNPSKVCACEKDQNFQMPSDNNSTAPLNFCGDNKILGCVDRPTLQHSKLVIATEAKVYKHPLTNTKFPAAQVNIVKAMNNNPNKPHYVDKDGKDACLNETDGKFYECSDDTKLSKEPVDFKKRLPIPIKDLNSHLIREYYPNVSLPPYDAPYSKDKGFCKDEKDHDVHYGTSGEFYRLNDQGKITSEKAKGDIVCKVDGKKYKSKDKETEPRGYLRDSKKYYGLEFISMIPELDEDGNIKLGRYTSGNDVPSAQRVCTPVKTVPLCHNYGGTTHFVPAGERNRDYCLKVPDQNNDNENPNNNPKCAPLAKGANDAAAMKLYCPGAVKKISQGNGDRICVEGSADEWPFKTIQEYYAYKAGNIPTFAETCNLPYKADYCSSSTNSITIDGITEPSADSAFALWQEGYPNTSDTGICPEDLGYEVRKKISVYDYPQATICGKSPAVTGAQCDSRFNSFKATKVSLDAKLVEAYTKAWDTSNKNLTSDQIMAVIQGPLTPFVAGTATNGADYIWYIVNVPPTRTIDKYGKSTYNNACVIKP